MASTLCTMLPYAIEREPQELLPAMPPIVAWALVETSTGNHSCCGRRTAFNASRTTPGWTTAVAASAFTSRILFRYFVWSMKIGRASCRERVEVLGVAGYV